MAWLGVSVVLGVAVAIQALQVAWLLRIVDRALATSREARAAAEEALETLRRHQLAATFTGPRYFGQASDAAPGEGAGVSSRTGRGV